MLQALHALRRADQPAGAAPDDILLAGARIDLTHGVAAASRARLRKLESFRALEALVLNHADNLWDDVAGPLHDHRIADSHVLAGDLVFVVQRRILHDDTADRNRLQLGDGRESASAADLNLNAAQNGRRLLGGEFVRDGETRRARNEAKAFLQIEAV